MLDVAIPSDDNMRKKEPKKHEEYQGVTEELHRRGTGRVVPIVVAGTLKQIPGKTSEIWFIRMQPIV